MKWIDYSLAILVSMPILATFVLGAFLAKSGKNAMGNPTIQPIFFLLVNSYFSAFGLCSDLSPYFLNTVFLFHSRFRIRFLKFRSCWL